MATIQQQLNKIIGLKQDMVDNLSSMGVQVSSQETITSLVPNILSIPVSSSFYATSIIDGTVKSIQKDSVSKIRNNAFLGCSSLITASFPNCTDIGRGAFEYCTSLTSVSFPNCTSIGVYAFCSCDSLTSVSFPNCTNIGGWAFEYCTSLTSVSFPNCEIIGFDAFCSCSSLTEASFPNCTSIGSSAFYSCRSLSSVSFPSCETIGDWAFYRCTNLLSLYLLGSSIAQLSNTNAFTSTPIGGYTTSTGGIYGSIYVPSSLYSQYIVAQNWSNFSSRFVSV